jgi:hypothetical protein
MSAEKFLVSDERVACSFQNLTIDGDSGYTGYVTNRRLLFLRESKSHDMLGNMITSMSRESKWNGLLALVIGISLLFLGIMPWYNRYPRVWIYVF